MIVSALIEAIIYLHTKFPSNRSSCLGVKTFHTNIHTCIQTHFHKHLHYQCDILKSSLDSASRLTRFIKPVYLWRFWFFFLFFEWEIINDSFRFGLSEIECQTRIWTTSVLLPTLGPPFPAVNLTPTVSAFNCSLTKMCLSWRVSLIIWLLANWIVCTASKSLLHEMTTLTSMSILT